MSEERQIKIKDNYLRAIMSLGYDYDGYTSSDDLKSLIDELVDLAEKGLTCDDTTPAFESWGTKYNILMEKLPDVR